MQRYVEAHFGVSFNSLLVGGVVADIIGLTGALWIGAVALAVVGAAVILIKETAPRIVARKGTLASESPVTP